jgi:hypothetical protein
VVRVAGFCEMPGLFGGFGPGFWALLLKCCQTTGAPRDFSNIAAGKGGRPHVGGVGSGSAGHRNFSGKAGTCR